MRFAGVEPCYHFGATVLAPDEVCFRLWAPSEPHVRVQFSDGRSHGMKRATSGMHEALVACRPGTAYRFCLSDGQVLVDPASRCQERDVEDYSLVVDTGSYPWQHLDWRGRAWEETVVYEVHVGLAGGFDGVRRKLAAWADLGITAIELMPIADFAGVRNWGYDGVLPFAPDRAYGSPAFLCQLIDAAHGLGLQVFLDVVYNHFGPVGNGLYKAVPEFFRQDVRTPWGDAIDFRRPEVRRFFTANALYWLLEYRFDGLRLDAVHAISEPDWLPELAQTVRDVVGTQRQIHLLVENDNNESSLLYQGFDAQWNDDAHHVVHHLLTDEADGYYSAYCSEPAVKLARALSQGFVYQGEPCVLRDGAARGEDSSGLPPSAFVFFLQNHDQTGNRAFGERLRALCRSRKEALNAAIALQLLTPHIPLIFMGEERGSFAPFLYFTDFSDVELVRAIHDGRQREFEHFSGFSSQKQQRTLPCSNALVSWQVSNPYAHAPDAGVYCNYRTLLRIRREFITPFLQGALSLGAQAVGSAAVVAQWRLAHGGVLSIYTNLAGDPCHLGLQGMHSQERTIYCSRAWADSALHAGELLGDTTVCTVMAPPGFARIQAPTQEYAKG